MEKILSAGFNQSGAIAKATQGSMPKLKAGPLGLESSDLIDSRGIGYAAQSNA